MRPASRTSGGDRPRAAGREERRGAAPASARGDAEVESLLARARDADDADGDRPRASVAR